MNRGEAIVKNTLKIFLGKFCTQFLAFILLPLYTKLLNTSEFGTVDLIITYSSLLLPIISLELSSALYRFLIDARDNLKEKTSIISFVMITVTFAILGSSVIFIIFGNIFKFKYSVESIFLLISICYSNIALQILRGFGNYTQYSVSGIIIGALTVIFNVFFLMVLKLGPTGMLLSITIANLTGAVYAFTISKVWKYIDILGFRNDLSHKLIKYSIPLIPNSIVWWVIDLSDKTIITLFLGIAANGIYSISLKLPGIITNIYSVFNLSFQEEISLHINDEDSEEYISKIFNKLFVIFQCLTLLLISNLWIIFPTMINSQYMDAINYIPILSVGSFFNVFVTMLGSIFIGLKKTKDIATSSIISGVINFLINILFITNLGIYAAALSTLISFVIIGVYRLKKVRKYFDLRLDYRNIIILFIFLILSILVFHINNFYLNIFGSIITIFVSVYKNYYIIINLYKNIRGTI